MDKLSAHFRNPKFGDVVILHPANKGYDIVKRVIGLPGNRVAIENGTFFIDGLPLPEIYVIGESLDMEEVIVKEDHIFVIGDNRDPGESLDSRDQNLGQLPMDSIKGYATISIFPM